MLDTIKPDTIKPDTIGEAAVRDLADLFGLVEVEITTSLEDAPADVYAEIVTAYVDPWDLPGCP